MKATIEERKEKGVELLRLLNIHKPYIRSFAAKNSRVCFFENFGGYWVDQEPEIEAKMREIEKEYNCTVYAITHEFTEFGECYDFLIVSDYKEEWNSLVEKNGACSIAYAYVWNKSDDFCSEFGSIGLVSFGGGIKRVA